MKYVITGTSCAGKTTTMDLLKEKGFNIVPETAEEVIIEQQEKGGDLLPDKDVEGFQVELLNKQLEKEDALSSAETFFLDRSIVDQYGYCNFYKVKCPAEIGTLSEGRYDKVFLLEPLPFNDKEFGYLNREEQLEVDKQIRAAYEHFGYEYIVVPFDKPEKRVEFILERV